MGRYLHALGLPVTLNIHDASGVNNWDAMFPALVEYLGLPASTTVVRPPGHTPAPLQ